MFADFRDNKCRVRQSKAVVVLLVELGAMVRVVNKSEAVLQIPGIGGIKIIFIHEFPQVVVRVHGKPSFRCHYCYTSLIEAPCDQTKHGLHAGKWQMGEKGADKDEIIGTREVVVVRVRFGQESLHAKFLAAKTQMVLVKIARMDSCIGKEGDQMPQDAPGAGRNVQDGARCSQIVPNQCIDANVQALPANREISADIARELRICGVQGCIDPALLIEPVEVEVVPSQFDFHKIAVSRVSAARGNLLELE